MQLETLREECEKLKGNIDALFPTKEDATLTYEIRNKIEDYINSKLPNLLLKYEEFAESVRKLGSYQEYKNIIAEGNLQIGKRYSQIGLLWEVFSNIMLKSKDFDTLKQIAKERAKLMLYSKEHNVHAASFSQGNMKLLLLALAYQAEACYFEILQNYEFFNLHLTSKVDFITLEEYAKNTIIAFRKAFDIYKILEQDFLGSLELELLINQIRYYVYKTTVYLNENNISFARSSMLQICELLKESPSAINKFEIAKHAKPELVRYYSDLFKNLFEEVENATNETLQKIENIAKSQEKDKLKISKEIKKIVDYIVSKFFEALLKNIMPPPSYQQFS